MIKELSNMLSVNARKHFCKLHKIPIKLFDSPYFEDRCELFDEYFGIAEKLQQYVRDLQKLPNEQEFFTYDNSVLQNVIDYLKKNETMQSFSQKEDMNKFAIPNMFCNIPSKDVWKDSSVGKKFISIDLVKANFQALKWYSDDIFRKDTWENFLRCFTDLESEIHSKHFRQVIFGAVNPARQTALEKFIMVNVLYYNNDIININRVVSLLADEIIYDVSDLSGDEINNIVKNINTYIPGLESEVELHIEPFTVEKIGKNMYKKINLTTGEYKYKNVSHLMMPFIIRNEKGEEPKDSDYVFINETGYLCQFLSNPLR